MLSAARHWAVSLAAVLATAACGASDDSARAPAALRALVVAEPPQLRVGEVGALEIAIVTPPGFAVPPLEPARGVRGLWLLDAERLPVEKESSRWIHRTRLRIRPHEVGALEWPAGRTRVTRPDGSPTEVTWDAVPVEVVSVLPEYPDRLTPFGVRSPEPQPTAPGRLAAAVGGAVLALLAVALVALLRRRRAALRAAPNPPGVSPWSGARAHLELARGRLDGDPIGAANAAATALRRYAAHRFGADTVSRTSEELAEANPPFVATTRWPTLISILRELDDLRFRPAEGPGRAAHAVRVAELLDAAERFVQETTPQEPEQ